MRKGFLIVVAAAILGGVGAVPAYASGGGNTQFNCTGTVTVTRTGTPVFTSSATFASRADVSGAYSRTYTADGVTFKLSASVSCSR
jgi:hypothetical protein